MPTLTGRIQMNTAKTYELTENEFRAGFALVKNCLSEMGGKRPSDFGNGDCFTWAYPYVLVEAGWTKESAAGTWRTLLSKSVVEWHDWNEGGMDDEGGWDEFFVCDAFWQWLDTVWDEKGGAA